MNGADKAMFNQVAGGTMGGIAKAEVREIPSYMADLEYCIDQLDKEFAVLNSRLIDSGITSRRTEVPGRIQEGPTVDPSCPFAAHLSQFCDSVRALKARVNDLILSLNL